MPDRPSQTSSEPGAERRMDEHWIDISVPLDAPGPAWPGSPGRSMAPFRSLAAGDTSTNTQLTVDVHCGTHVDAPAHFIPGADPMGAYAPTQLCGPAVVVDGTGSRQLPASLAEQVPESVAGVLFRTDNSERRLMRDERFEPGFAAVSRELAEALAAKPGLRFVGNDYLSVQPYRGDRAVHTLLMDRGIAIIEGIDLADVRPGRYEMLGLTLRMPTAEAAPARILLRRCRPSGEPGRG